MAVIVAALFAACAVLALLASVGVAAMGPFQTLPAAVACAGAGLLVEVLVYGRRPVG